MNFQQSSAGRVIRTSEGYKAFIPNSLPPRIKWNTNLVSTLSRADFLIGKLAREGNRLPNPHLLLRPFITREAVLSSRIEGTQATIGEILAVEAGAQVKQSSDDLQEVQNYIKALEYGILRLKEFPLSLRVIKEIHLILMEGVRGEHATPGEFRLSQNWIGAPGCTLNTAKFVPPPPDDLMECLGQLELFLHDRDMPPLIHIAICHYQLEAIHPFLDGNGRIGRLLITLLLIEQNILPSPLLYLSAFFEATRHEYYEQLYSLSAKGSWDEWLCYFLNGVATQSHDVLVRAESINRLLDMWKMGVADSRSDVAVKIVNHFAVNPYLTVNRVAEDLEIAYSTAQRGVLKLEKAGIIQKIGDRERDKLYCAKEILDILEEPVQLQVP